MTINVEKITKHMKKIDCSSYYDKLLICSYSDVVRDIATFIFDNRDERKYFKKNLPVEVYVKVLEALVDGDHDT